MKAFEYRGYDRTGKPHRGLVDALSVKDAREKLARVGVLAERVVPTGRQIRFPPERRSTVYRELSALLGAGMPLVKALDVLIASPEMGETGMLLAGVRDRVREGGTLAAALAGASPSVSAFEKAIIEAAEKSATMEPMLERLAGFLEEQVRIRERVHNALIYPAIILTVGVCVAVIMLGLLVPRTRDILSGSQMELPLLTRAMIALGRWVLLAGVPALLAGGAGWWMVRARLRRDPVFLRRWDRQLFRLPLFGRGYSLLANLRFARTLSILSQGGVSLVDGILFAGRATGSPWIEHLAVAQAEAVRHGSRLADAIRRIPPLSGSLPGWVEVGEASGGIGRLLDSASERYQEQWERFISRSLTLMEPVLILLIGGFVLMITLSVLLPVLTLSRVVGQ